MQRLAQATQAHDDDHEFRPSRAGAYFAVGLMAGGLASGALLLTFASFAPASVSPFTSRAAAAVTAVLASLTPAPVATPADTPAPARAQGEQADVFEVVIDRSDRASAPFGLRLVGSEDESVDILVRDVPAAAALSRGQRRDASTWALKAADLKDLQLSLSDGIPDTFDVRIDVVASPAMAAMSSVMRVRLVDAPNLGHVSAVAMAPVDSAVPTLEPAVVEQPFQTEVSVAPRKRPLAGSLGKAQPVATPPVVASAAPPPAEERHWPEGASGLGGLPPSTERQVWWKMPALTWVPFQESAHNK